MKFEKFRSGYIDSPNSPLYPFGYGLSYTTFEYSDLTLSATEMTADGSIRASVKVTNSGKYDADEIVQLYIRDMVGTSARPVKELKGFKRVHIKAGETAVVDFDITVDLLKYYNFELEYVAEPGEFAVMVGPDSERLQSQTFTLK